MTKEKSPISGFVKELGNLADNFRVGRNLGVSLDVDLAQSALGLSILHYGSKEFPAVSQDMATARANVSGAIEGQRGTSYCSIGLAMPGGDERQRQDQDAVRRTVDLYNRMLGFYATNGVGGLKGVKTLRAS